MAELGEIREALADALSVLPDAQVSAYFLHQPTPPAMHIYPGPMTYDVAFGRGLDLWTFQIQAFVPLTSDIAAQRRLDEWLNAEGSTSIKQAAEADKTLGGLVADLRVISHGGYAPVSIEGRGLMLMAEWTVEVHAASS
jgi:hypothetical protein